ncbi:MAG: MaoC/PaaZ C-terminal domain-containing protein [Bacteroidales bacterium]|jgi:3-hydroxyacyl-[acyl-carrier-protein] dehydratase|nr:MaoC/PaaZ C-terminal domain-containing protein [Bacteroidales bacterium]
MMVSDIYNVNQSLITIDADSGERGEFTIEINPESDIFKGHFPGTPVLPGACTLSIVKDCTEQILKKEIVFYQISQCKFTGMVDPEADQLLDVKISVKDSLSQYSVVTATVLVSGSERVILKFKGKCSN